MKLSVWAQLCKEYICMWNASHQSNRLKSKSKFFTSTFFAAFSTSSCCLDESLEDGVYGQEQNILHERFINQNCQIYNYFLGTEIVWPYQTNENNHWLLFLEKGVADNMKKEKDRTTWMQMYVSQYIYMSKYDYNRPDNWWPICPKWRWILHTVENWSHTGFSLFHLSYRWIYIFLLYLTF